MKRAITVALACTVALALPATSGIAGNGIGKGKTKDLAERQCNAEKKALKKTLGSKDGRAELRRLYGKHAMRNCKRAARSEVSEEAKNAAQACRAERDANPPESVEAFKERYGTNDQAKGKGKKKNAFGQCVSHMVRGAVNDGIEEFKNAAKECRFQIENDPEGFEDQWGARRNAFGKCVSSTATEPNGEE